MRMKTLSAVALLALSALALPAMADDTVTVKGVVHDADGKPVAKAQVRLLHRAKGEKKLEEQDTTTSDTEGGFEFKKVDNGTYVIVAVKKNLRDRAEITVHDGKDPELLSFNIREGKEEAEVAGAKKSDRPRGHVNFVGQVVDKNGKAVVGATVKLMTGDDDASTDKMVTVESVESEAKGRFEFYKATFAHYIVDVRKGDLHVTKAITLKDTDGTQSTQIVLK